MDNLQLIVAVMAFIFAAALIPMSRKKMKGKGVRTWRLVALGLLMLAALLSMFGQGVNLK
ncbi:MAG: hypothetical protein VR67_18270 [Peptococcaceae bacterium BRH_c8a]|nr:MAG: hypothetical protein VR67_18270 [Peptococcaceae bacterium BRH_c8a]